MVERFPVGPELWRHFDGWNAGDKGEEMTDVICSKCGGSCMTRLDETFNQIVWATDKGKPICKPCFERKPISLEGRVTVIELKSYGGYKSNDVTADVQVTCSVNEENIKQLTDMTLGGKEADMVIEQTPVSWKATITPRRRG